MDYPIEIKDGMVFGKEFGNMEVAAYVRYSDHKQDIVNEMLATCVGHHGVFDVNRYNRDGLLYADHRIKDVETDATNNGLNNYLNRTRNPHERKRRLEEFARIPQLAPNIKTKSAYSNANLSEEIE